MLQRRASLRRNCAHFEKVLNTALERIPPQTLRLRDREMPAGIPDDVITPVFALLTDSPKRLEAFLRQYGYGVTGLPYPVVPLGEERIRVIVHAENSPQDIQHFVDRLAAWGTSKVRCKEDIFRVEYKL